MKLWHPAAFSVSPAVRPIDRERSAEGFCALVKYKMILPISVHQHKGRTASFFLIKQLDAVYFDIHADSAFLNHVSFYTISG